MVDRRQGYKKRQQALDDVDAEISGLRDGVAALAGAAEPIFARRTSAVLSPSIMH